MSCAPSPLTPLFSASAPSLHGAMGLLRSAGASLSGSPVAKRRPASADYRQTGARKERPAFHLVLGAEVDCHTAITSCSGLLIVALDIGYQGRCGYSLAPELRGVIRSTRRHLMPSSLPQASGAEIQW